ncbi:MAG: hypothetical protein L6N96_02375 [Candidatus Methylarchaceae archaeon HK02M2]|nr:hypothetical protein [Candidatus Methylarchaceae archaeon HK02M2]
MNICKRRKITTIFSSAARSYTEIVPPRVLYKFYKLIGGDSMIRREILLEIPDKQLIEKLDLGTKNFW